MKRPPKAWSTADLEALIFDLDGVITRTAIVHRRAWRAMFEEFFQSSPLVRGREIEPYREEEDYLQYIDGKPRYDGVQSLLESRKLHLPYGSPSDGPGEPTICGLGNKKNLMFLESLRKEGVHVYQDTITKIRQWRQSGLKTAVISSSKSCKAILESAGVDELFDVRVDGLVSVELEIPGKPAPEIFLEAARQLQTSPSRCAIFEDAIAGVQAGRAGDFRYVIGVARRGSEEELYANGADIVIRSFEELE